jgi:hypothetical protein
MAEDQGKLFKTKTEIVGRLLKVVDMATKENTITSANDAEYFSRIATRVQMAKSLQEIKEILQYYRIVAKPEEKK